MLHHLLKVWTKFLDHLAFGLNGLTFLWWVINEYGKT